MIHFLHYFSSIHAAIAFLCGHIQMGGLCSFSCQIINHYQPKYIISFGMQKTEDCHQLPYISFEADNDATLFLKYREGKALPNAPFKLVSNNQHSCSSTEEEYSNYSQRVKIRGPYRRYSN